MKLSRRDLLAAFAAVGISSGAGSLDDRPPLGDHDRSTLVAVAKVVYPSEVRGVREFVEQYSIARVSDRPDYASGMADAIETLDAYATDWFGAAYVDLTADDRQTLLDQMSVDVAEPDPEGTPPERVRFYVVNDLLYAFYTTPTGGELVGIENPQGHPGGIASYQQGPT